MTQKISQKKYTFRRNSTIGAMDAESDQRFLNDCFMETGDLAVLQDCHDPKRIVVGRVGAGKSALIQRMQEVCEHVIPVRAEDLSLNYISNSDIIQFFEEAGVKLDLFYQLLWKHAFVTELIKYKYKSSEKDSRGFLGILKTKISRDQARQRALEYVDRWGDRFWMDTEIRVKEFTTKLEEGLSATLDGNHLSIPINASGARKLNEETRSEIVQRAQHVVNSSQVRELGEMISFLADDVFTDPQNRYYIVIDRLDDHWVDEKIRYKLIRALIETIRAFLRVQPVKIIITMREDLLRIVFDQTRDAGFQEEKYESLFLRLRWRKSQLQELIDLRIEKLVRDQYTQRKIVFNDVFRGSVRNETAFDYVVDRSLNRPRDVISFVNICIELCEGKEHIPPSAVQDAERRYSDGRLRSLADEWRTQFPNLLKYADLVRGRPAGFKISEITEDQFQNFMTEIYSDLDAEDPIGRCIAEYLDNKRSVSNCIIQVLKALYQTSVIGIKTQASDRASWSYLEDRGVSDGQYKPGATIYVHKMLWRSLDIQIPERRH